MLLNTIGRDKSQDILSKVILAIAMGLLSVGCLGKEEYIKRNYAKILKGLWE